MIQTLASAEKIYHMEFVGTVNVSVPLSGMEMNVKLRIWKPKLSDVVQKMTAVCTANVSLANAFATRDSLAYNATYVSTEIDTVV